MSDKWFGGQVGVGDEPLLGTSGWGDMSMLGHPQSQMFCKLDINRVASSGNT